MEACYYACVDGLICRAYLACSQDSSEIQDIHLTEKCTASLAVTVNQEGLDWCHGSHIYPIKFC